jgi:ABC-2 type transport system permease protein
MKRFLALVKADYLDHKWAIWLPPLIVLGFAVLAMLAVGPMDHPNLQINIDGDEDFKNSIQPLLQNWSSRVAVTALISAAVIAVVSLASTYFMVAASLRQERSDRSILFWKSLPLSDWLVVASKLCITIGAPVLLAIVSGMALILIAIGLGSVAAATEEDMKTAYHLLLALPLGLMIYVIWAAPLYGWFMLASSFANRSPFLVAILPLIGVSLAEGVFFGSRWFGDDVLSRIFAQQMFSGAQAIKEINAVMLKNIASPEAILGVVVGGLLIYAASEYRRLRAL